MDELALLTYNQRVAEAACMSVGPLKNASAARSAKARIVKGEKRRWSQYNTDDYPHVGNGMRSASEAALDYGVSTAAVQRAITIKARDPALFAYMEDGNISVWEAYEQVRAKREHLTPLQVYRTLETLSTYIYDTGWSDKLGRVRVPGARRLKQEGASVELMNILWPRLVKAHEAGNFELELAFVRSML